MCYLDQENFELTCDHIFNKLVIEFSHFAKTFVLFSATIPFTNLFRKNKIQFSTIKIQFSTNEF